MQLQTFVIDCFPDFSIIPKYIETHTSLKIKLPTLFLFQYLYEKWAAIRVLFNDEKILKRDWNLKKKWQNYWHNFENSDSNFVLLHMQFPHTVKSFQENPEPITYPFWNRCYHSITYRLFSYNRQYYSITPSIYCSITILWLFIKQVF